MLCLSENKTLVYWIFKNVTFSIHYMFKKSNVIETCVHFTANMINNLRKVTAQSKYMYAC